MSSLPHHHFRTICTKTCLVQQLCFAYSSHFQSKSKKNNASILTTTDSTNHRHFSSMIALSLRAPSFAKNQPKITKDWNSTKSDKRLLANDDHKGSDMSKRIMDGIMGGDGSRGRGRATTRGSRGRGGTRGRGGARYSAHRREYQDENTFQKRVYRNRRDSSGGSHHVNAKQDRKFKKSDQGKSRESRADEGRTSATGTADKKPEFSLAYQKSLTNQLIHAAREKNFATMKQLYGELQLVLGEEKLLRNEPVSNAIVVALIQTHRISEAVGWFQWLYKLRGNTPAVPSLGMGDHPSLSDSSTSHDEEATKTEEDGPTTTDGSGGFFYPSDPIVMRRLFEHYARMGNLPHAEHYLKLLMENHPAEKSRASVLNMWMKTLLADSGEPHRVVEFFEERFYGANDTLPAEAVKRHGHNLQNLSPEQILNNEKEEKSVTTITKRKNQKAIPNTRTLSLLLRSDPTWNGMQMANALAETYNLPINQQMLEFVQQISDQDSQEEIGIMLDTWKSRISSEKMEAHDELTRKEG